jgi:hypothetical protein
MLRYQDWVLLTSQQHHNNIVITFFPGKALDGHLLYLIYASFDAVIYGALAIFRLDRNMHADCSE